MRLGLPEDYVVGYPSQVAKNAYASVEIAKEESRILDTTVTTQTLLKFINRKTDKDPTTASRMEIEEFNNTLQTFTESFHKKIQLQTKQDEDRFESQYTYKKKSVASEMNTLDSLFNRALSANSSDVNRVIRDIEERRRREEEERRRKEEEEKRRIEEEKRRIEELKRKQKEEEERKRKEAEEKKRLEQEKLKKQKEEEERKKQEKIESEKRLAEEEKLELERIKKEEAKKAKGFTSVAAVEEIFLKYKKDIVEIKEQIVGQLNQNKELKKEFGQFKRKINPKFGQLSNSMAQLDRITREVLEYISFAKNANDLIYNCILNFVAKSIVSQAEAEVTVKPNAAIPLARLTERILATFPEFEYFLSCRLVKKCPFIIGYTCSIESEEGRTRMGWKRSNEKWELEGKYEERVAGICTLWAVITRTADHLNLEILSMRSAWVFLARLLNTNPKLISNPHFSVACNWLEACALQFLEVYGKQGLKLCSALVIDFPNSVADKELPAATALKLLGKEWMQNGRPKQLKEMEP